MKCKENMYFRLLLLIQCNNLYFFSWLLSKLNWFFWDIDYIKIFQNERQHFKHLINCTFSAHSVHMCEYVKNAILMLELRLDGGSFDLICITMSE